MTDTEWEQEVQKTHDWLVNTFRDLGRVLRVDTPEVQVYARAWMPGDGSVVNFSLHLTEVGKAVLDITAPVSYSVVRRLPDPLKFAVDLLTPIRDAAIHHVLPSARWPKQV